MSFFNNPKVLVIIKYFLLLLFFALLCGLSFTLLFYGMIKGTEFVALIIASLLFCLVVNFLNDIQEVSIGGNIFRLKDINKRSEVLLNNLQIEYYKMRIVMAFAPTGFFSGGGNSIYKSKIEFFNVIREIKSEGLLNNPILRQTVEEQLVKTLQQQLEDVQRIGCVLDVNYFDGKSDPLEIRGLVTEEVIKKSIRKDDLYKDENTAKNTILMRIEIYENFLKARKWLED